MLVHFAYLCDDYSSRIHVRTFKQNKNEKKQERECFLLIFLLSFLKVCFSAFHSPLSYCAGLFSCKNCGQFSSLLT